MVKKMVNRFFSQQAAIFIYGIFSLIFYYSEPSYMDTWVTEALKFPLKSFTAMFIIM